MLFSRRSFFRKVVPLAAVSPVAVQDSKQVFEFNTEKKYLIVCDSRQISFSSVIHLKETLDKMGVSSVVVANADKEAIKLYELES